VLDPLPLLERTPLWCLVLGFFLFLGFFFFFLCGGVFFFFFSGVWWFFRFDESQFWMQWKDFVLFLPPSRSAGTFFFSTLRACACQYATSKTETNRRQGGFPFSTSVIPDPDNRQRGLSLSPFLSLFRSRSSSRIAFFFSLQLCDFCAGESSPFSLWLLCRVWKCSLSFSFFLALPPLGMSQL